MKGKRGGRGRGRRGVRRFARKGMVPRRRMNRLTKGEFASCKVTHNLQYITNDVPYKYSEFSLVGFPRAAGIAANYQFYRINLIEVKFLQTSDTYIAGNPGEVPQLYYQIDKADTIPPNYSVDTLINMGSKPIRFDDKNIVIKFKPAVTWKALDENGTNNNFGMTKVSPWLSTNDNNTSDTTNWNTSSVDHHGIAWYVSGGVGGQNYVVEITAHFQFKKPLYVPPLGEGAPPLPLAINLAKVSEAQILEQKKALVQSVS